MQLGKDLRNYYLENIFILYNECKANFFNFRARANAKKLDQYNSRHERLITSVKLLVLLNLH